MTRSSISRRLFVAMLLAAGPASAQTLPPRATMSVREAHARSRAKEVILVDIRRPEEWADTGVAEGAIKLDMTSPVFEARLAGLRAENPGKPIAIICRTANRTRHAHGLHSNVCERIDGVPVADLAARLVTEAAPCA